jgi:hypothetical protein
MLDADNGFDLGSYNDLPILDDATTALEKRRKAFEVFFRSACKLLRGSPLGKGDLAAFLLHRHWVLPRDSVMLETPRRLGNGQIGLVTAAIDRRASLVSGAAPCRWAVSKQDDSLHPLEYSLDQFVHGVNAKLRAHPGLVKSLVLLIQHHNLADMIGLMVVPREALRSSKFRDFVETNEENESVVTGKNLTDEERSLHIKVGWTFSPARMNANWTCCYCMHTPDTSCRHPKPDPPPVCSPHGCVKPDPNRSTPRKPKDPSRRPTRRTGPRPANPKRVRSPARPAKRRRIR